MVVKILAIDPGGTTGWALFEINSFTEPRWKPKLAQHFTSEQLSKPNHHDELDNLLQSIWPDLIIGESFQHRDNKFAELISVEYIGVIKRFAQRNQRKVLWQTPSEGMTWADIKKMEHLELVVRPYVTNKDANAARKHLLFYLAHKSPRMIKGRILVLLKDL